MGKSPLVVALLLGLGVIGCKGGGSGFLGLFPSNAGDLFDAFASSGNDDSSSGALASTLEPLTTTPLGDLGGNPSGSVHTVHNPEPASMALFGGGLVALAISRRKKSRRA